MAAFLESRGFVGKPSTRVGDFGEVLAGALLQSCEDLQQPISKLCYREKSSSKMRLTDVFALRIVVGEIESFCFASVKSATTTPSKEVGVSGYSQLIDDAQVERPEILWFVSEQLFRQDNFEYLSMLDDAVLATTPIPKQYRLVFVFDSCAWKEAVLIELENAIQEELSDFKIYLLICPKMKEVVENSYNVAIGRCYSQ